MSTRPGRGVIAVLFGSRVLTALGFGISGLAFITANLLLARLLPVEEYAVLALLISIGVIAGKAGPLGVDVVINRNLLPLHGPLLRRIFATSCGIAVIAVTVAAVAYDVRDPSLLLLLAFAAIAQALIFSIAARYQALQDFVRSLGYLRGPDFMLLLAAGVALSIGAQQAFTPLASYALALILMAMAGALAVRKVRAAQDRPGNFSTREALTCLSVQLSADGLMQLERLAAPAFLSLRDLATLGVVLAIVGPPFRLLQMTVGYTLQPKLRLAADNATRRRLLAHEALLAGAMVVGSCVIIWFFAQQLIELTVGAKYDVPDRLLIAALLSGALKVASGFARASATALASNEELARIGTFGWIGLALAALGAYLGSPYGLPGLIYGVSVGWAIRMLAVAYFVGRRVASGT